MLQLFQTQVQLLSFLLTPSNFSSDVITIIQLNQITFLLYHIIKNIKQIKYFNLIKALSMYY